MKKLFEFLISGCWHQWHIIDEKYIIDMDKYDTEIIRESDAVPWDKKYVLQCKKCGNLKEWRT